MLLHVHGIFEERNKVLESSIIIINYCIVVINAYYGYIHIMHSIIIVFLMKASSRNAIRKKKCGSNWAVTASCF